MTCVILETVGDFGKKVEELMKVLIAVDDRTFGDAMADFVCKHQWSGLAEFKVVHVLEPILLDESCEVNFLPLLAANAEQVKFEAKALVRHVALKIRTHLKSTHVEEVVLEGHPKESILALAKEWPADAIVVGSHGRRGISQLIMGSVSSAIVQNAPCTITVVRLSEADKHKAVNEKQVKAKKEEILI